MSFLNLEGKKILVTGASSGIGRATAQLLSTLGAELIIGGRNPERLQETFNSLQAGSHMQFRFDVNEAADLEPLVKQLPALDGVVHAAGIMKTLPFKFINRSSLEEVVNTNFIAPLLFTQLLLKHKLINANASLVFISSIAGNVIGTKGNLLYSASKGALNASLKVLALELAGRKIRVNNVAPGMVKTEMWQSENSSVSQEQLLEDAKKYPLGFGEPTDVANATAFLLSEVSKWMTGSTLVIDGGFTIQ
jgi:NAD(P)-dependent dehydrogenase (short-subunit alcohol dehydrogenase family)